MTMAVTPAASRLGVGVIGGGFMAEVHAHAARSARAELVGLASSGVASAQRAASRLGFPKAYRSADELLADASVQVVHICTPNTTHAGFAAAAIDAGKHVICEKPLATSVADAEDLVERVGRAGITATVPFVYRYHPLVREARERVARGDLGTLLTITGNYLQDWLLSETDDDWRVDTALGGPSRAFADIGSHLCDLVEFVTGDSITRLAATKRTVFPARSSNRDIRTEDAAALVIETASGAIGTLLVSQVAAGRKNQLVIEIAGSAESLRFDQEQPETLWIGRRVGSELLMRDRANLSEDAARLSVLPAGHPMGYQDAFNAFIADSYAAAVGEWPSGLPSFEDGVRAVRLTDAVLESASSGTWVGVPDLAPVPARVVNG